MRSCMATFSWPVPEHFNMAQVCCQRWASAAGCYKKYSYSSHMARGLQATFHSYAELQEQANRLSNVLTVLGVSRGDRVAIVMPQRFETAVAYMAVLQMGAVAMPLSMLFGPEALEFRLHDSEAVLAIGDATIAGRPASRARRLPAACAACWAWATDAPARRRLRLRRCAGPAAARVRRRCPRWPTRRPS